MASTVCTHCHLEVRGERWVKFSDRLYHARCWDVIRSEAKLKNARSVDGALLCPECGLLIREGDGTAFRDAFAVH